MKEMCVIYWTISYQEIFKFLFPVSNKGTRSTFKQNLFGLVYFQGTEFQMWICCAMDDFKSSRFDTIEELVSDLEKRSEETTQNAVYREKGMKIWKSTSDAHISTQRQKEKKGEKSVFYFLFGLTMQLAGFSFWPGIEPVPPAVKTPSPNHWTTKEVLKGVFLNVMPKSLQSKSKTPVLRLKGPSEAQEK